MAFHERDLFFNASRNRNVASVHSCDVFPRAALNPIFNDLVIPIFVSSRMVLMLSLIHI